MEKPDFLSNSDLFLLKVIKKDDIKLLPKGEKLAAILEKRGIGYIIHFGAGEKRQTLFSKKIGQYEDYDIDKLTTARDNLIKDINTVASDFANTDIRDMNSTQYARINKQLSASAMTSRGKRESILRNEAEIRNIFTKFEEYEELDKDLGKNTNIPKDKRNY